MFFIPLSQSESVELVVHALRVAGGEADCGSCPVRKVCMKQCLTIAASVERMLTSGSLPWMGEEEAPKSEPEEKPEPRKGTGGSHLKVIK